MKLRRLPDDFFVEERCALRLDPEGAYAVYLLEKRSLTTLDACAALARAADAPAEAVGFAGLKDRHAVTRQPVSIPGGPSRELRGHGFRARFLGRSALPVSSRDLQGNRFRIVVRDLSKAEAAAFGRGLRDAVRDGLPNFFDEQRFGSARHGKGFAAALLARGDPEGALRLLLAEPARKDRPRRKDAARLLAEDWGEWRRLARVLPAGFERRVASHLARRPDDFTGAWNLVDRQILSLVLHAWQSWLWNRIAVAFLDGEPGLHRRVEVPYRHGVFAFHLGVSEEARGRLRRIEIPLPAKNAEPADPAAVRAFRSVLAEDGLEGGHFRLEGFRGFFKGEPRALWFFPEAVHVDNPQPDELHEGRRKVRFFATLPPGSYATMLVKRAGVQPKG